MIEKLLSIDLIKNSKIFYNSVLVEILFSQFNERKRNYIPGFKYSAKKRKKMVIKNMFSNFKMEHDWVIYET